MIGFSFSDTKSNAFEFVNVCNFKTSAPKLGIFSSSLLSRQRFEKEGAEHLSLKTRNLPKVNKKLTVERDTEAREASDTSQISTTINDEDPSQYVNFWALLIL